MTQNNKLENILKNKNMTQIQKIDAINSYYDGISKELERDLNSYLLKQYIGVGLEIGSAAIPFGGVGKVGGKIGQDLLKKYLGRKISQNIGTGTLAGAASGSIFGLGEGLKTEHNPILSSLAGTVTGAITGGGLGSLGANIEKIIKGNNLKNYGNIDELGEILRKNYSKDARNYYKEYLQEIQIDKNGKIDFSKRGIQEQLRWNPHQAQNFSDILKDLKTAKRLPDEPNSKPLEKPHISHYEVYRGELGDYKIEVSKRGERRFYITDSIPDGTSRTTNTTSIEDTNNIIPYHVEEFKPSPEILYGGVSHYDMGNIINIDWSKYENPETDDNRIFTRENIKNMSGEEFRKNEQAIFAQLNSIGIPTNRQMEIEHQKSQSLIHVNSYTRSNGTKVQDYYRSIPKYFNRN